MKRVIALILACMFLLTACGAPVETAKPEDSSRSVQTEAIVNENAAKVDEAETSVGSASEAEEEANPIIANTSIPDTAIKGLDDETLLTFVEGNVYSSLVEQLGSEDYFVENVEAIYYPKEYIDALAANTQPNVYFGYTSAELNAQFQGTKYVFTLKM